MTTKITKENINLVCKLVSSLFAGKYPVYRTVSCSVGIVKHGLKIALSRSSEDSNVLVIPYEAEFTCCDTVPANLNSKLTVAACDAVIVFRWSDVRLTASPWGFELCLEDAAPKLFA